MYLKYVHKYKNKNHKHWPFHCGSDICITYRILDDNRNLLITMKQMKTISY